MNSFEYMYLSDNSTRMSQKSVLMCGTCVTNGNKSRNYGWYEIWILTTRIAVPNVRPSPTLKPEISLSWSRYTRRFSLQSDFVLDDTSFSLYLSHHGSLDEKINVISANSSKGGLTHISYNLFIKTFEYWRPQYPSENVWSAILGLCSSMSEI